MSIKSQKEIARANWGKIKDNRKYAAVKDLTSKIKKTQKEIRKWEKFGEEDKPVIDRMKTELEREKAKGWMSRNKGKVGSLTDGISSLEKRGEGYKTHIKKNEGYNVPHMKKMVNQVFDGKTKEGSGRRRKSRRKRRRTKKKRRKSKKSRRKRRRTKKKRRRRR